MSAELVRHLFTVEQYHQMGEAGVFGPDERVELLGGEVIEMSPIGSPHAGVVNRLNRFFVLALGDRVVKRPYYAAAGIVETWIIDVVGQLVEVATDPGPGDYRQVRQVGRDSTLTPVALPELILEVADLFG